MRNRFFSGLMMFALSAASVQGSTIDPQVQVRDPSESGTGGPGTVTISDMSFTVLTLTGNSPVDSPCTVNGISDQSCDFINGSGQSWSALTIDVDPGQSFDSCAVLDFFAACTFIQHGGGGQDSIVYLYGGVGIPDGQAFGISLSGWAAGTQLITSAQTPSAQTPEPDSCALMLVSCALLTIRSRHRRH